jgi:hypothetical protein
MFENDDRPNGPTNYRAEPVPAPGPWTGAACDQLRDAHFSAFTGWSLALLVIVLTIGDLDGSRALAASVLAFMAFWRAAGQGVRAWSLRTPPRQPHG